MQFEQDKIVASVGKHKLGLGDSYPRWLIMAVESLLFT